MHMRFGLNLIRRARNLFYGAGVFVLVEVHNVLVVPTAAAADEAKLAFN